MRPHGSSRLLSNTARFLVASGSRAIEGSSVSGPISNEGDPAPIPAEAGSAAPVMRWASLLEPHSRRELEAAFLDKKRLLTTTKEPLRATSILPRWALDRLIVSDYLPPDRLTVMRGGEVIAPAAYRGDDGRRRPDALEALVREGVSFLVSGIDDDVPAIARLCDSMERRFGHTIWVNAYVTHGAGGALAPHYDDHDVIVLQIDGAKRWFGHGSPVSLPVESSPDGVDFGPSQWDALLGPGDLLYLPRGEVHHTHVEGTHAIHLTFGIDTRRGVDLMRSIVEGAAREVVFREDLTRLGGTEVSSLAARRLKDRMHELVEEADTEAYLADDDAARPLRTVLAPTNPALDETTVVIPTVRRAIAISFDAISVDSDRREQVEIRAGGMSFRVRPDAARVLSLLIENDHATLGDIASTLSREVDAAREAIRELVRLGLAGVELHSTDAA